LFVEEGNCSFGYSAGYDQDHLTDAQRDLEDKRHAILSGDDIRIRTGESAQKSAEIKNIVSAEINVRIRPYFFKSFSLYHDKKFYTEFNADICICVNNPAQLLLRLIAAIDQEQLLGDWELIADLVKYRKLNEALPHKDEELFFLKKSDHAWQKEYRVILAPRFGYTVKCKDYRENLIIGSIRDICTIISSKSETGLNS
jgi:hypothetical protein